MTRAFGRLTAAVALVTAGGLTPQALSAQSLEALDQMVPSSAKSADALALARAQAGSGALLDALATLERVLMADPKNKPAKLLHASILCRVDDPDGAAAEFAVLKAKDYKKAEWAAAREPCAPPASPRSGSSR